MSWVHIGPADIEPATTDTRIRSASGGVKFVPNGTCQKCGNPLALFRQAPIPTVDFPEVLVGAMSLAPGVFSPDREVEVEG